MSDITHLGQDFKLARNKMDPNDAAGMHLPTLYNELMESYCTLNRASKPPLPYFSGQEFTVSSHTPPPPMARPPSGLFTLDINGRFERQLKHPLKRCLIHPPSPGHAGHQFVRFKISREIRFRDNHSSQVGLVDILDVHPTKAKGPWKNTTLLAKFYDPLYNDHDSELDDPFYLQDYNYSHEVAAYLAFEPLHGKCIPKLYGSFTLELPAPEQNTNRLVRLILLEYIPGRSMASFRPGDFSQQERQGILDRLINAEIAVYSHGFWHGEILPEDIIVNNKTRCTWRTRPIVLVDFATSTVAHPDPNMGAGPSRRYMTKVNIALLFNHGLIGTGK